MRTNGYSTSFCLCNVRRYGICFRADDLATLMLQVCRAGLASYLILYLSLSGLIYVERWSKGAHVTPDMWAEHHALTRLGYVDHHHAYDSDSSHAEHKETSAASASFLPFVPVWSALPEFPLILDWTPFMAVCVATLLAAFVVGRLHIVRSHDPFKDYLPPIPLRPPITAS